MNIQIHFAVVSLGISTYCSLACSLSGTGNSPEVVAFAIDAGLSPEVVAALGANAATARAMLDALAEDSALRAAATVQQQRLSEALSSIAILSDRLAASPYDAETLSASRQAETQRSEALAMLEQFRVQGRVQAWRAVGQARNAERMATIVGNRDHVPLPLACVQLSEAERANLGRALVAERRCQRLREDLPNHQQSVLLGARARSEAIEAQLNLDARLAEVAAVYRSSNGTE